MSSISSYQYQPLGVGEIRLLQLLPPDPQIQNDTVRLNIVHTSFARCHVPDSFFAYEALSYVWGGDRTEPVYCDEREILVTPNLVSALLRLRKTMPEDISFHRTLWVDAICIDQNDVVERGHQVRLMSDIYSNAGKVIVWLGESQHVKGCLLQIRNGYSPPHLINRNLEMLYFAEWGLSVAKLFDEAWFQRVWVIQEVVFAASTIVMGGEVSIKWDQLVDVAVASQRHLYITASQRMRCDAVLGIECLRNQIRKGIDSSADQQLSSHGYVAMRDQWLTQALESSTFVRLPKDLLELAELFRSYSATDPRDKIYAILGLASALETDRLASRIDADYALGAKDLFLDLARLVVSGPDALRLLRDVDGPREQLSGLPSWVPDWSKSLRVRPLAELCKLNYLLPTQRPTTLKHPDPSVLKLVGKRIDVVEALEEVLLESTGETHLRTWSSWTMLAKDYGGTLPGTFNWDAFSVPQENKRLGNFRSSEICAGRRYLWTKKWRSGLAPAGAEVGNEIVLFPGAQLPFVIARSEFKKMYRIIGECYLDRVFLDSLMDDKQYKDRVYSLI